jgi:hypothetical protein
MSDGKAVEVDAIRVLNAQMSAEEKKGVEGVGFFRELLDQSLQAAAAISTETRAKITPLFGTYAGRV